jgi:hypothetical protein
MPGTTTLWQAAVMVFFSAAALLQLELFYVHHMLAIIAHQAGAFEMFLRHPVWEAWLGYTIKELCYILFTVAL